MKKLLLMVCMALMSVATYADEGDLWAGGNANYSLHSDYKNAGLGVKGQYEFVKNFRAEASANYFFEKKDVSMWEFNVNVHWVFPISPSVNIYPLAGLAILTAKSSAEVPGGGKVTENETKLGANLGAGIEFPIMDRLKFNFEAKYQIISDFDRPVISVGVAYQFM